MRNDDLNIHFEKRKAREKTHYKTNWVRLMHNEDFQRSIGFKCIHCHIYIHSDEFLSGVQNRNHCPYCLWSKHVDLHHPGDRLAACKTPMQPVGLSLKKTPKKYGQQNGELMIVHLCSECGGVSVNRIAADDDAEKLHEIYVRSLRLDAAIQSALANNDIRQLEAHDVNLVTLRLFGRENQPA